jgi:Fe-S oxidoreductase
MNFNFKSNDFWSENKIDKELRRVIDICNGCRRCYNLCPSFSIMFTQLDDEKVDGDSEKLSTKDIDKIVDLCYECQLCYNHCPYTPPHYFDIDFPRLILKAKAIKSKKVKQSFRDKVLTNPDLMGGIGKIGGRLINFLNKVKLNRIIVEKILGVHRNANLPDFQTETFADWFRKYKKKRKNKNFGNGKVVLFYTCSVNYNEIEIGKACVEVLEKNGVDVICPEQRCCGVPKYFDNADFSEATESAKFNVQSIANYVKDGYAIVSPGPSCSMMIKKEYPLLSDDEDTKLVAQNTYDICEYLMKLQSEGKLDTKFINPQGKIIYQLSCHLRAQNIGYKSRDLMKLIPGTEIEMIERCSGHDGTFGMKVEFFEESIKIAKPIFKKVDEIKPDKIVSDCSLSGLQIQYGTQKKTLHPIQILKNAYGL